MSPFLDSSLHIRWSTLTPDAIVPDITAALADWPRPGWMRSAAPTAAA